MPPMVYTRLPSPTASRLHIRFIRLDPNLDADGRIQCSLIHGSLTRDADAQSSNPVYYALSYEWGGEDDLVQIEIDSCGLSIRQNLWRYLSMARRRPELHNTLLWVDAVCIDQTNIQERNEQVTGMGEVYAGAERVVVWLGYEDITIERIFEFLNHCHTSTTNESLALLLEDSDDEYSPVKVKEHRKSLEKLARDRFRLKAGSLSGHVSRILDLTYWTRAWVAQELFHAKCTWLGATIESDILKHVTLHYGESLISLECLRSSANAIEHLLRPTDPGFWRFRSFTEYMNLLNGVTPKLNLHECFRLFNDWPAKSTDPRDLIYALRSMFFGGELLQVEYAESLDLLLLRMLIQLKHSHFAKHDRNWLDYSEARTIGEVASRYGKTLIEFQNVLLSAMEKLKQADTRTISAGLQRQYEESLQLIDTGLVNCNCKIQTLPWDILFSSPQWCLKCNTFRQVLKNFPNGRKDMRSCSLCDVVSIPWDTSLSTAAKCTTCHYSLLIPPGYPSNARYACSPCPDTSVGTHVWLAEASQASSDQTHPNQNLHVLDLLLTGIPWRIQFSLPNVRVETYEDWESLKLDFKSWLQIYALDHTRQQCLVLGSKPDGQSEDDEKGLDDIARLKNLLREIRKIACPRRKDEAMPLVDLTFWFVTTTTPGRLFTLEEFEAQL